MSKMDSYMQGRTEGMEFALRLVKDKGIEELEKEIKFRQRTGISLNVTRQELNAASKRDDIRYIFNPFGSLSL